MQLNVVRRRLYVLAAVRPERTGNTFITVWPARKLRSRSRPASVRDLDDQSCLAGLSLYRAFCVRHVVSVLAWPLPKKL